MIILLYKINESDLSGVAKLNIRYLFLDDIPKIINPLLQGALFIIIKISKLYKINPMMSIKVIEHRILMF